MTASEYQVSNIHVLEIATPVSHPGAKYEGLKPSTTTIPAGFRKEPDCREFGRETLFERDIEIPLRHGTKIRADVFRPTDTPMVPAIVHYSPYGKSGTGK
jgi:predicted acyl esterase